MELLIDFTMHKGIAKQLEAFRGIYIILYFQARRYFLKNSRNHFTQWLRSFEWEFGLRLTMAYV